jgi:hypothetical protein
MRRVSIQRSTLVRAIARFNATVKRIVAPNSSSGISRNPASTEPRIAPTVFQA